MKILFRLLSVFSFLTLGGLAYACPSANLPADQSLDVFALNQAHIFPAVLEAEIEAGTCETLAGLGAAGYINPAPALSVQLGADQAGGLVFSGRSTCDTLMVVQQPDQSLLFNDDGGSAAQPLIATAGASGTYLVWMGQYDDQASCEAEVVVAPGSQSCPDDQGLSQATVGLSADTMAEGLSLATRAGGVLDMAGCSALIDEDISAVGFTSLTPQFDFVVTETADESVTLEVPGFCDTSLLALDSSGAWHFNDDGPEGFAPRLTLPLGDIDSFKVWIGTYSTEACDVDLSVFSEGTTDPAQAAACPAIGTQAATELVLRADSDPDPLNITLGGPQSLENCTGDVANAYGTGFFSGIAHANLIIDDNSPDFIRVSADATCDGVMLAVDPEGIWQFNDDADGVNPGLSLANLQTGTYSIWVGTYGEEGTDCTGTLSFSAETLACPNPALPGKEFYPYALADLVGGMRHPVIAGGYTDASACGDRLGANGFFMDRPDFEFDLSLNAGEKVQITSDATCDTVLLVHSPDGTWHFDDDSGASDFDSQITTTDSSGTYQVWLGTYGADLCEGGITLKRGLFKD